MRVLSKSTLRAFWVKHPDSIQALRAWHREVESHQWKNINEIKLRYPNISIIQNNRLVFNIKGNHYRLVAKFNFDYKMVLIRFIGTHAEYDKIDANTI
jgi:mRNA interferase HigB